MILDDCTSHQRMLLHLPEVADVDADVGSVWYGHVLVALTADSAAEQTYQAVTVPGMVDNTGDGGDVARSSQTEEPVRQIQQLHDVAEHTSLTDNSQRKVIIEKMCWKELTLLSCVMTDIFHQVTTKSFFTFTVCCLARDTQSGPETGSTQPREYN
jgi:hypothetical protein